jgi:hypothetical protein
MFQRSGRAQLVLLLVATAPLLWACGTDEAPPPLAPASANSALAGSLSNAAPATNDAPCTDKQVRECRVELGRQGTISNCFVGLQLCTDGSWGPCGSAADIDAQLTGQ